MTKTANYVNGPRHHTIQFEPWAGGPSSTTSVHVPRKLLVLHPSAVSPGCGSTGTAPVVAKVPPARGRGRAKNHGTAAARQKQQQQQAEEEEEDGEEDEDGTGEVGGVGVLSSPASPASSVEVYPAGTTVVVPSVEADPGRTLKFARGETKCATFEEVLGREVS